MDLSVLKAKNEQAAIREAVKYWRDGDKESYTMVFDNLATDTSDFINKIHAEVNQQLSGYTPSISIRQSIRR